MEATTVWGKIFTKKPNADPDAPSPVEALQYRKGMGFDERYRFLKFINGMSVTIYAENLVFKTAKGDMKVSHDDWIVRQGNSWYFVGPGLFVETYVVNVT